MSQSDTFSAGRSQSVNRSLSGALSFNRLTDTAVIGLCAALVVFFHVHLAFTRTLNWDEFHFLGQIVSFNRGETLPALQTLHVELFQWLPGAAPSGVDAVLIGRAFMLVCEAITAFGVFAIARRFAKPQHAALAALLWLASGYTIQHGFAFRTDPMATALATSSLAVLARAPLKLVWMALAGILIGVAGAVTIKAILYLPAFAGMAYLRWEETRFAKANAVRIATIR